jgi:outer membrane receptor protein involved in Fe transport
VLDQILEGNPFLKVTEIKNYDARLEWFPRAGEILSVGFFYKDLKNPIERQFGGPSADLVQFVNRPEATVYGVEFEARKSLDFVSPLLDKFTLGGNLALIESEEDIPQFERDQLAPFYDGHPPKTRPLTDQSPYILNLELAYDNAYSGTSASLQYNVYGPRLIISSPNSPDLYEQPAPSLDFVITQRIGRHARLKFAAKNLLNPKIEQTYGKHNDAIYSSYTRGITFGLTFAYDF